jgi:succinyl-CoA synthetase alpha subunit
MAQQKIALEFKDRHLTRPILDQIIGAQRRTNPDATEVIIRCRSAAKTVYQAIDSYDIKITIVARKASSQDL